MPTPAPSPAAPEAAVPLTQNPNVTPATAAASATPATPPAPDGKTAGRGNRLFGLLAAEADTPPGAKPDAKKPAATPAPDGKEPKTEVAPAAVTPPPAADGSEKPIKAEKRKPISKRPELPVSTPAATPAPTPAAPTPDNDADLVEEERNLIEEATEAEKYLPNRKGLAAQTKKFVREHQKYLEAHPDIQDDPDEKAAYEAFLKKNRPALSAVEQRTISEARIAANVAKPLEEKTAKLEHDIFVRDQEPIFREQRQRVTSELNSSSIPDDIMEFAKKYGADVAKREYADELRVVNHVVTTASDDYEELIRLETYNQANGRPVSSPAANESDPKYAQHQRLLGIVNKVDSDFKETAKQSELMRDGKWFVTREEWSKLPPASRGQFWHFTNREVATRMLAWVKPAIEETIKNNRAELESRGYQRRPFVPPAPAAAPAVPPTPVRSPGGPGASPVPAPAAAAAPATAGSRLASALTAD